MGDLKSPDETDRTLGVGQLASYLKGIKQTKTKVNQFVTKPDARVDTPTPWEPVLRVLGENDITLPKNYERGSTDARQFRVYRYRNHKLDEHMTPKGGIQAYLYVVYDGPAHRGIWMYEYVPVSVPKDGAKAKAAQEKTQTDLQSLINDLNQKPDVVMTKRKPGPLPRPAPLRIQRRVDKKFDSDNWHTKFTTWQRNRAKPYLASKEGHSAALLETLLDIKNRGMPNLAVPSEAEAAAAGERKIRHWNAEGKWHGHLRGLFGTIYLKFSQLYSGARDRFRRLLPSSTEGSSGGLGGKLLKVGMKILRYVAHVVLREVAERLKDAFRKAAENVIENLFGREIAEVEEQIHTVRAYINDFEKTIKQGILEQIAKLMAPFVAIVQKIQEVASIVRDSMNWVNRLKWLVRAFSCALAPAWGCLWSILSSELVLAIGEYIAGTCKFRREAFEILRSREFVRDLPLKIVDFVVDTLKSLVPERARELLGAPDRSESKLSGVSGCEDLDDEDPAPTAAQLRSRLSRPGEQAMFDSAVAAYGKGPTKIQLEIMRIIEKWDGRPGNPLRAVRQLLVTTGFGVALPMNMDDLKRVDDFLDAINGDAKAILDYIKTLQKGKQEHKYTFAKVLKDAEQSILHPTVKGYRLRQDEPKQIERPEEGGVVIFRW